MDHKTDFFFWNNSQNEINFEHHILFIGSLFMRISTNQWALSNLPIPKIWRNHSITLAWIRNHRHISVVFLFYCVQVILMLIVIVLFFFLCWGPILLNNLLVALNVLDKLNIGFLKPMRMAFHLLSYSNSCVNPIVYGIMSHNFRDRLRRTLSRRATRSRSLTATSTFQSRSSTMRRRQNSNYSKTRL